MCVILCWVFHEALKIIQGFNCEGGGGRQGWWGRETKDGGGGEHPGGLHKAGAVAHAGEDEHVVGLPRLEVLSPVIYRRKGRACAPCISAAATTFSGCCP